MTDLVEGNTKSRLFRFMLPLLAGNFLQQCYSFADGVIVGQVVGKNGLAAIGASNSIQFLMVAVSSVTGTVRHRNLCFPSSAHMD